MALDPTSIIPGSWFRRRRYLYVIATFAMSVVAYCLIKGDDGTIYRSAIDGSLLLLGASVGAYVFGAAWEGQKRG